MLILRIKRAEVALDDGRLDEAAEIARAADVRAHARGQELIGQLARALAARGRSHLEAGRLEEALADCDRATDMGGNLPELVELRASLKLALSAKQATAQRHQQVLAMARRHVDRGELSLATALVNEQGLDHAPGRAVIEEAGAKRQAAQVACERATASLARQDWAAAVDATLEARGLHAGQNVLTLAAQVTDAVVTQVRSSIEAGRLDTAQLLLDRVRRLAPDAIGVHECGAFVSECRTAWQAIRSGQPRRAAETLRKLSTAHSGIGWLKQAVEETLRAAEAAEALSAGPLAWLGVNASHDETLAIGPQNQPSPWRIGAAVPVHRPEPAVATNGDAGNDSLPQRLWLHVDGIGSFLAIRSQTVRIGPAGSSRTPDVALSADPGAPTITIQRTEDDYFLTSDRPVNVSGTNVTRKLLRSGDVIALSTRCRLKFSLPHPASPTAVLTLHGTRLPNSDARHIVLMDRALVLGPGPSAHVRADLLREAAILVVQNDRLQCRTGEPVTVNDGPMDRTAGLPLGQRVRIGPVQMVIRSA